MECLLRGTAIPWAICFRRIFVEWGARAFEVKVEGKRLPVSPFSGLLKGCKGHKTHRFENGGTNQIRKTGKRAVVFLQPLPQTLYQRGFAVLSDPCHHQVYDRFMSPLSLDPRPNRPISHLRVTLTAIPVYPGESQI